MTLQSLGVRAWPYKFEPKWRNAAAGPVTRDTEHPGKAKIGQNVRLGIVGEEPSKLNAPFGAVGLMEDLFRAGELFIAGHLAHGLAEAVRRKSGQSDRIEMLRLRLRAQLKADRGVGCGLANSPPQGKKLFGS